MRGNRARVRRRCRGSAVARTGRPGRNRGDRRRALPRARSADRRSRRRRRRCGLSRGRRDRRRVRAPAPSRLRRRDLDRDVADRPGGASDRLGARRVAGNRALGRADAHGSLRARTRADGPRRGGLRGSGAWLDRPAPVRCPRPRTGCSCARRSGPAAADGRARRLGRGCRSHGRAGRATRRCRGPCLVRPLPVVQVVRRGAARRRARSARGAGRRPGACGAVAAGRRGRLAGARRRLASARAPGVDHAAGRLRERGRHSARGKGSCARPAPGATDAGRRRRGRP